MQFEELENLKCTKCSGTLFEPKLSFKKISRILTGAASDGVHPYEVMVCSKCNEPLPYSFAPADQQGAAAQPSSIITAKK